MTRPRIEVRSLDDTLGATPAKAECRMHVDGMDPPATFVLPSIKAAREEAKQIDSVMNDPIQTVLYDSKRNALFKSACEPLGWNLRLPNLFKFCFFVHEEDIPDDLLEPAIWALKTFKRVMEEASDGELLAVNHLLPGQEGEVAKRARNLFLTNIRVKLAIYHLKSTIDQPAESVKFFEEVIKDLHEVSPKPWVENPWVYGGLGEGLLRTGGRPNCERAKIVLKQALTSPCIDVAATVGVRAFLARILRALGEDAEAETEEAWLIKWYRKNPHLMESKSMRRQLLVNDTTPTPVLVALGGLDWLEGRRHTDKTDDRKTKLCRQCHKREPTVKLARCARCQHIWYCSKKCQKANWALHKVACNEMAAERLKIEQLSLTDTIAAQRASDWAEWRVAPHEANTTALIHALGLHKDRSRGRTHIVFKQLQWNPKSKTLRNKFRVTACGVFRISEVLPEIEQMLNLDKGEGVEYVKSILQEFDSGSQGKFTPIIDLSFGVGIHTWIGSAGCNDTTIRGAEYNPNWRETMNVKSDPPGKMEMARKRVKDAENVF